MKARGRTKDILQKVVRIQKLVGEAKIYHDNDRDPLGHEKGGRCLEEASKLCLEITALYDPID